MSFELIQKYNVPGPRYTSYPTVPYWETDNFSPEIYKERLKTRFSMGKIEEGISLYIHLPFCESLCTFCGCNKRITKNHEVETPYIEALLKELDLYVALFGVKPIIQEVHLGGGTPTFFSVTELQRLIEGIFQRAKRHPELVMSFEGHPNNTSYEHLKALAEVGFSKVSFGVQDYNESVQRAIHRLQPFENVKKVTQWARDLGYESVGHDLIFGLPFQTVEHIEETIRLTNVLRPDRIAFYSYAHVPWIKGNGQRGFDESNLPTAAIKRAMYERGKNLLEEVGYVEIGMDHFSLPTDDLYQSMATGRIHRNFMGYTPAKTDIMIGLGVSAISDSWTAFAQNEKILEEYLEAIEKGELPVFRGHLLSEEDELIRTHILNLMCQFTTSWVKPSQYFNSLPEVLIQLKEFEKDGLLYMEDKNIFITEMGRPYVRNICMAFDLRLQRNKPERQLFSMTV